MSDIVSVRMNERLLRRLDRRVESGEFKDRSEAIREATRRLVLEGELLERATDDPDVDETAARELLASPVSED